MARIRSDVTLTSPFAVQHWIEGFNAVSTSVKLSPSFSPVGQKKLGKLWFGPGLRSAGDKVGDRVTSYDRIANSQCLCWQMPDIQGRNSHAKKNTTEHGRRARAERTSGRMGKTWKFLIEVPSTKNVTYTFIRPSYLLSTLSTLRQPMTKSGPWNALLVWKKCRVLGLEDWDFESWAGISFRIRAFRTLTGLMKNT